MTLFDVMSVAYRSRLIFRTDAEYRRKMGASFETVVNNRDSERMMENFYLSLSRSCEIALGLYLYDVVEDYVNASELYRTLDWGDRTQMASRKKFCRKLFRLYSTAGKRISDPEDAKFGHRDADPRLLKVFFPDGEQGEPAVNLVFILLFAYGVIRPWGGENTRGHDLNDKDIINALRKLRELIAVLKEDMPQIGSTEKPMAFDNWLSAIDYYLEHTELLQEVAPLTFFNALTEITNACRNLCIPSLLRGDVEKLGGIPMDGIWIDDADKGRTRFWIFPDNCIYAFCYQSFDDKEWILRPYELHVRLADSDKYADAFLMLRPEGNKRYIENPEEPIPVDLIAQGSFEVEYDETTDELTRVMLYDGPGILPEWLDWRTWERLSPTSEEYKHFREILDAIYNPNDALSRIFQTLYPELIDYQNQLQGRDRKYLYVYDRLPRRFVIRETAPEVFKYLPPKNGGLPPQSLFDLKITPQHPLYAFPLKRNKSFYNDPAMEKLAKILEDAENINQAFIYHPSDSKPPRLILTQYSASIPLDPPLLQEMGIKVLKS